MNNFPKKLWTRLQDYKDAPAIVTVGDDGAEPVSYWEWTRRVQNLAMALMDADFSVRTRMGMVAPRSRDWLDLAVATWLVGGCLVPLDPDYGRDQMLRCLGRSGCQWLAVGDDRQRARLRGSGEGMPAGLNWVVLEGDEAADNVHLVDEMERRGRHLVQRGHTERLARRIYGLDRDLPALIWFEPDPDETAEGAFFAGAKVDRQLDAIGRQMGLKSDGDTAVATTRPFGEFSSFLMTCAALYTGQSVAMPTSPDELDDQLPGLRPTHLVCGPEYLQQLAEGWQKRLDAAPDILEKLIDSDESDASALTGALGSIGEKAAQKLLYDPISEEFGGRLEVLQVFGGRCPVGLEPLVEGAGISLLGHFGLPEAGVTHVEHPDARRAESCGRPVEGIATKLLDARTGEAGQLCIRGDTIFDDYWAGEGPRKVDEEGWIRTGRVARLESGFLFLEDGEGEADR